MTAELSLYEIYAARTIKNCGRCFTGRGQRGEGKRNAAPKEAAKVVFRRMRRTRCLSDDYARALRKGQCNPAIIFELTGYRG